MKIYIINEETKQIYDSSGNLVDSIPPENIEQIIIAKNSEIVVTSVG